jgi:RNAse (barnase) inhibitor barstar
MKRDWELLLVLDPTPHSGKLYSPSTYMPVWIVDSPANLERVREISAKAEGSQISSFTTFKPSNFVRDPIDLSSLLGILEVHHPYMTRLNIMGLESSPALSANLQQSGYSGTRVMWPDTIAFKRPLPPDIDVPELHLDAANWTNEDDVYDSLFAVLEAPAWHGRNFNALNDSIVTGDVNSVEVPYRLIIRDLHNASPAAKSFAEDLIQVITEFGDWGCPVWAQVATV